MADSDFTFPKVETALGLRLTTERLFADAPEVVPRPEFLDTLTRGMRYAQGNDTEKAQSELLIAPMFLELARLTEDRDAFFSGVEFRVDPDAGLNGYCDFLITKSPRLYVVTAPVVAVAEGKNGRLVEGYGQCIAAMRAAWLFNAAKKEPVEQVYGVSTIGTSWKFLRLRDRDVVLDLDEYPVQTPGKILGILLHMVQTA